MEESPHYRVTRHFYRVSRGPDSKYAKVIFEHLDEGPVMAFYHRRIPVPPGIVIAAWRPDGSLIAFTSGGAAMPHK